MIELQRKPTLEATLRRAVSTPETRAALLEATGWHESMLSKIISGDAGITLDRLNKVLSALELVTVSKKYMDYLAYGNEIGTNCACARAGYDACGLNKKG